MDKALYKARPGAFQINFNTQSLIPRINIYKLIVDQTISAGRLVVIK